MDNLKSGLRTQFVRMLINVSLLAIIGGVSLFIGEHFVKKNYIEHRETLIEKRSYFSQIDDVYDLLLLSGRGYFSFGTPSDLANMVDAEQQLKELLLARTSYDLNQDEQATLDRFDTFTVYYFHTFIPQALQFVESDDRVALQRLADASHLEQVYYFYNILEGHVTSINEELISINEEYIFRTNLFSFLLVTYILGLFGLLYLLTRKMYQKIVTPLGELSKASSQLARGEYNIYLPTEQADEIGLLSRSFTKMAESIQYKEEELSAQNEELQAQQIQLLEQQDVIQNALTETETSRQKLDKMNQLNHMFSIMANNTELLKSTVEHLATMYNFDKAMLVLLHTKKYASIGVAVEQAEAYINVLEQGILVRLEETRESYVVKRYAEVYEQALVDKLVDCYDYYAPIFASDGELIAILVSTRIGRDYEEQEKKELDGVLNRVSLAIERLRLFEETEEVRLLNQDILNNVNEGIQLVGLDGALLQVNEKMGTILNSDKTELLKYTPYKKWLAQFQFALKRDPGFEAFLQEAISSDTLAANTYQYEIETPKRYVIEVYSQPLLRGNNKIGTLFVHRDITKAFEIDQMKSELVSTVSHELRTPLSSILGFTEMIIAKDLKPERQKKYLETIHKEAIRLTNLINDFLDLQRMEAGKQAYELETVEIHQILEDMLETFRVNYPQHRFVLQSNKKELLIFADKAKLIQVYTNLLSNAVKFSPNGGKVVVLVEEQDEVVKIHISDEGLGIPGEEISRLFQKFHRIDNSDRRKIGGTGLGLAICKEIVTAHGGEIDVRSQLGIGSTFTVTLPAPKLKVEEYVAAHQDMQTGPKIVVLEDDLSLALLLKEELSGNGFQVLHYVETDRAIQAIKQEVPSIIVVDLMIGTAVEGWSLIEEIKANDHTSHIPIIISSALDEKEKSKTLGVKNYLTKPYPPSKLSNVILETLLRGMNKGEIMFPEE